MIIDSSMTKKTSRDEGNAFIAGSFFNMVKIDFNNTDPFFLISQTNLFSIFPEERVKQR